VNYLNLASIIYIGYHSPLISKPRNRLEMFNEFMICVITFVFMSFTDVILNESAKWDFGEIIIWLILYYLYVNIMVVGAYLVRLINITSQMIWVRYLEKKVPWAIMTGRKIWAKLVFYWEKFINILLRRKGIVQEEVVIP